jgi:hypothetical protein
MSVGISRLPGCRIAQDHPRGMRTLCASRTCRSRTCTPEVTGPTDAFLQRRSTGARDQSGVPRWLTTARGQCGDHIHVHLIDLGICVRHARYAHNHAETARSLRKRQRRNPGVTEIVKIPNRGHAVTLDHARQEVTQTALNSSEAAKESS